MLTLLVGVFAFGTLGFYILMGLACLALLFAIEYEKAGWATITLITVFTLLAFFGNFNIAIAVRTHPIESVLCLGGYFVFGTFWSITKWWFFVRARKATYDEYKAEFLKKHNINSITSDCKSQFKEFMDNYRSGRRYWENELSWEKPIAKDNKSRIMTWMVYWPWSMVWTLLNDPVKKMFKAIYNRIVVVFDKISDNIYSDSKEDL